MNIESQANAEDDSELWISVAIVADILLAKQENEMIYYALVVLSMAALLYAAWRMKKHTSKKMLNNYRHRR